MANKDPEAGLGRGVTRQFRSEAQTPQRYQWPTSMGLAMLGSLSTFDPMHGNEGL